MVRSVAMLCLLNPFALLCRKPVKEFIDVINAVQPADISKLATKLFKSPLTYGAIGDIANMPRYEEVAKRFK